MARKRYLVTRPVVIHEDEEIEVVLQQPGDEVELDDAIASAVQTREPGALLEMDPRTKSDWDKAE